MKRAGILISMLILILSVLAGCSKAESAKGNAGDSGSAARETVEITYYTWTQNGSYPEDMIAAFEKKYPYIKVNFELGSSNIEEYLQLQKVKFLSGEGADVTTIRPETREEYVDAGYLMDLSGKGFIKNYNDAFLDMVKVHGKVYSVPYALDAVGTIYNKTLFEKNGWKVPANQKEWLDLCRQIKASGMAATVNGYKDAWPILNDVIPFVHEVLVRDPEIFSKINRGEAAYTDAVFLNAFKEINAYFDSGVLSKEAMGLSYDQALAYFATGKAAMIVHGEWALSGIKSAEPDFEIGILPVFHNDPGEALVSSVSIGQSQAVTSFTKHPEEALLFVEFMSGMEGAQMFADNSANFTPVTGIFSDSTKIWEEILAMPAVPFYWDLQYSGAQAEFMKQMQLMYINEVTPEEAARNIQAVQDKK